MRFRGEETACRSCQEIYPTSDLDRQMWCLECRRSTARRGALVGRLSGLLVAAAVGLYIIAAIDPSGQYLLLYAVVVALSYVLVGRIVRSLVQGFYHARGRAPTVGEGSASDFSDEV